MSSPPFGIARYTLVSDTMGFDVAFIHDVDAKLITQVIEDVILRIVRCAYRIDVGFLDQLQVFAIDFLRHIVAFVRRKGVVVDAADLDRLAIVQIQSLLMIHLVFTETKAEVFCFCYIFRFINDFNIVELRFFCRP